MFTIRSRPVDFGELAPVAVAASAPAVSVFPSIDPKNRPMGCLSGVRAGERLFQIQTELAMTPAPQVMTVVILDGRTVLKRVGPSLTVVDKENVERLINEQHGAVEAEVRDKLASATTSAAKTAIDSPKVRVDGLVEEGLSAFLAQDYKKALAVWQEAIAIDPANKTLSVNIGVVKRRLGLPVG